MISRSISLGRVSSRLGLALGLIVAVMDLNSGVGYLNLEVKA